MLSTSSKMRKKRRNKQPERLGIGKKTSIVIKTVASDVLTTSELAGKRRTAQSSRYVRYNNILDHLSYYDFLLFNN